MSLKPLTERINLLSVNLALKKGIKERIQQQCDELKVKIDSDTKEARIKKDGHLLLLAFISQRREAAISSIEETGTYALKAVAGDDYKIHFLKNEEKKNSAAFKMEIGIESNFNNQKVITGLKDERGGGMVETVSFGLRFAALELLGYDGPIILDEAFKSVSSDEKIVNVAELLKLYVDSSKRQMIFATHKADVFEQYADHIISVKKIDGISQASEINKTEDEI